MPYFVFMTSEGFTFSPSCDGPEPDMDNLQVLGFAEGNDEKDALQNLLSENPEMTELFSSVMALRVSEKEPVHLQIPQK